MKNSSRIVATLLSIPFAGAALASVAGVQGLHARNSLVTDAGVQYSVMDVFIKFNSSVGSGTAGERVVNVNGQATTDASTFGVNKTSKYENSLGLAFQHSNTSWLPGAGAAGGAGNNAWDSFLTIGARTQGAGNSGNVVADQYFSNPNSNVGAIIGGANTGFLYVGAGFGQNAPSDPGFETNASANADRMVMIGRFSLRVGDLVAGGGASKLNVWLDFTGKSTAQTGGATMFNMIGTNLKSDAQTRYTTGGKTWTFDSSFDGATAGQEAWTFAIPAPGVTALLGLAGWRGRRRR